MTRNIGVFSLALTSIPSAAPYLPQRHSLSIPSSACTPCPTVSVSFPSHPGCPLLVYCISNQFGPISIASCPSGSKLAGHRDYRNVRTLFLTTLFVWASNSRHSTRGEAPYRSRSGFSCQTHRRAESDDGTDHDTKKSGLL